ncbi:MULTISPECIES: hypothetical protein [unclassified Streptomyces]|uniref:hypothetical protein n=1 Tax=unclassified Streptomyces TaxID=2593676 RepID=UPI002E2DE5A6|nr:hypothetical protein [Streptomyces sp. NBC_01429]
MIGFLTEATKRIADRWFTELLLPGCLLLAVLGCALRLGHAHALDAEHLVTGIDHLVRQWRHEFVRAVVDVLLLVAAACVLGLAAQGCGWATGRCWLRSRRLIPLPGLRRAVRRFVPSRRDRAERAARRAGVVPVADYLPQRPTWMSDRVRLIEARVRAQHWISVTLAWPRVWLLADETARAPVQSASRRFGGAVVLAGWAECYALVGLLWWPALAIGGAAYAVALYRARVRLEEFATLVESLVDVRVRALCESLGVALSSGRITSAEGALVDDILHKGD